MWAPHAQRVEVLVRGVRHPMASGADGWFDVAVDGAGPGDDYAYALDGGPPRPDPRSPWQPHGVHGPSRLVDHAAFRWTDGAWRGAPLAAAVLYELHVGTFTPQGTFEAAIEKLPALVDLGVTAVELMPVAEFPGMRGWGYDGVDLWAPHHAYGEPDGLKRLVDACHAHGLAVVLDVVYNHLGPDGNYLGEFGPYFIDRYTTPWGPAVNLDGPGSPEVRAFFLDNASMWLRDYHVDGLRLDAVHAIIDNSAVHFLEELAERVEVLGAALGRTLWVVAESDLNDPRLVSARDAGGHGLDAQWNDDFHHALHTVLTGERTGYYEDFGTLADLAKALERAFVYDRRFSRHRRRTHGRAPLGLSGHRFLGYLQNHDQIGNRARGERSAALVGAGHLKIAAALVLTAPFIPLLFMGEEWAASTPFLYFTDHEDPKLAEAVREGRRREFAAFGWRPDDVPDPHVPESFARSKLRWEERTAPPHADLLDWHRRLLTLRRGHPALTDGRLDAVTVRYDERARWLVLERGDVTVACNFADAPVELTAGRALRTLLASVSAASADGERLRLAPASVVVGVAGGP